MPAQSKIKRQNTKTKPPSKKAMQVREEAR